MEDCSYSAVLGWGVQGADYLLHQHIVETLALLLLVRLLPAGHPVHRRVMWVTEGCSGHISLLGLCCCWVFSVCPLALCGGEELVWRGSDQISRQWLAVCVSNTVLLRGTSLDATI